MIPLSFVTKRVWLFVIAVSLLFTFFTPIQASAATASATDNMDTQTERWLRFRGIYGCIYESGFYDSMSDAGIFKGTFFDNGATAIGYLNEDGKVSCNDGAFVTNSVEKIGFKDNAYAYCAAQPGAYNSESTDTKTTSDVESCVNGKGTFWNGTSKKSDQASQWMEGLKTQIPSYKDFMTDSGGQLDASKYYMYYQSLATFCGAEQGDLFTGSREQDALLKDPKKVLIDVVDGEGKVQSYIYDLNRNKTETVNDIYNNMGSESDDWSCQDMAKRTRELSAAMAAYVKQYNILNPDAPRDSMQDSGSAGGSDDPVCSAGALGWVFCPLSEFMADTVKGIAGFMEGMLTYKPLLGSEQGKAIQAIWGVVLVIANVGLIIAFMFVVFSQATSIGISSYGIKKLLPKIIAAAVLMNLSFFICAAAVDIANILGVSVKGVIDTGMKVIGDNSTGYAQSGADWSDWAISGTVGVLALAIGVGTGAIALLLPVLVSAVLAVLTAFLVLAAREVLITLLIIVAPLAFLAWILPNTESWFTKWRKLFTAMLMMFPLVMGVFYGSVLVSSLILATNQNGTGAAGNINDFMVNLLGFGVLVVPLFSLPFIMKSAGGVLDRLGILVNNRNRGLVDRTRKKGQEMYGARQDTRRMNAFNEGRLNKVNPWKANMRRTAVRDYQRNLRKGIADENTQEAIAGMAMGDKGSQFAQKVSNSSNPQYIAAVQASAKATADKLDRQSVANREVLIRAKYNPVELLDKAQNEFENAALTGDTTAARAAQNILLNAGTQGLNKLSAGIKNIESAPIDIKPGTLNDVKRDLNAAGVKPKDNALATWAYKDGLIENIRSSKSTYAGLNDAELVGQSPQNIQFAVDTGAITPERARGLLDNPTLTGFSDDKRKILNAIAPPRQTGTPSNPNPGGSSGNPPTPPPTPPPAGGGGTP